jgi:hypothetical protein
MCTGIFKKGWVWIHKQWWTFKVSFAVVEVAVWD